MNTKPKAKKFRVRRSAILPNKGENQELQEQARIAKEKLSKDNQPSASIPVSELSARQLKMAGRLAERKGLKVSSDEDAVTELRKHGIDPFTRGRLEIVPKKKTRTVPDVPGQAPAQQPVAKSNAPVPVPQPEGKVPGPVDEGALADERSRQIMKMRRDLVKRRRRNLINLGARLVAFVAIPTILAGYYFSNIASPLYSTHSDFLIQQSESSAAGGMGSPLPTVGCGEKPPPSSHSRSDSAYSPASCHCLVAKATSIESQHSEGSITVPPRIQPLLLAST